MPLSPPPQSSLPFDFRKALEDPSPQGWMKCARELDRLWTAAHALTPQTQAGEAFWASHTQQQARHQLDIAVKTCTSVINSWPTQARKAVPRDPLPNWRRSAKREEPGHDALLDLCLKVIETQTYSYYEDYVCNDPALLWRESGPWGKVGAQRVHLARSYTGAARSMKSGAWLQVGERGQGDLRGWFSLMLPGIGLLALYLEVEVKMPTGRLSKAQRQRAEEISRAGGLYISARSVRSVVGQCIAAERAILSGRGPAGVLAELDAYREEEGW